MTQDNIEIMSDRSPNDDALSPGRIETLVDVLANAKALVVYSSSA